MKPAQRQLKVAKNFVVGIIIMVLVVLGITFFRSHQNKVAVYSQDVQRALAQVEKIDTTMGDFYVSDDHTFLAANFDTDELKTLAAQLTDAKLEKKTSLLTKKTRALYEKWHDYFLADQKMMTDLQNKEEIQTQLNNLFENPVLTEEKPAEVSAISMSLDAESVASVNRLIAQQKKLNDDTWLDTALFVSADASAQLAAVNTATELLANYQTSGTAADYLLCQKELATFKEGLWKKNLKNQLTALKKVADQKNNSAELNEASTDTTDQVDGSGTKSAQAVTAPEKQNEADEDASTTTNEAATSPNTKNNASTTAGQKNETPTDTATKNEEDTTTAPNDDDDATKEGDTTTQPNPETGTGEKDDDQTADEGASDTKVRPIESYHGNGIEFPTNAAAEKAGQEAVNSGQATSYVVVEQHFSDGSIKYFLELTK